MNRYCVRLKDEQSKRNFLCIVGENDPDFELEPEGNPVTVWIQTNLSVSFLESLSEVVQDVIESNPVVEK